MQTKRVPYEVLFRFDDSGALVGSHVQWKYIVQDEKGDKVAEAIKPATAVAVGDSEGFPLADILTEVQRGAVLQAAARASELEVLRDEHDALKIEHGATAAALGKALVEVDRLKQR